MGPLPARRFALGALCAALLAGVTGPAAMAADTAPVRDRAASSALLLARAGTVDARQHGLTPVVDLVRAVLEADDGRLSTAEARRLGDAARAAVTKAADEDPVATTDTTLPAPPDTTTSATVLTTTEDDLTPEELADLREALDDLMEMLLPGATTSTDTPAAPDTETDTAATTEPSTEAETETETEAEEDTSTEDAAEATVAANLTTAQAPAMVDELLARVDSLLAALLGTEPETASTLPAPAGPAQTPLLPGLTLPALTSVLVPSS
ncbi:hypothetical protein ACI2LV_07350 [Streptomyces fungicidicus]|uniref:hypothetical protein n=1 Tax=Streptomyces fungicidicus TaxID=68203 RepID=UPI00385016B6